MSTEADAFKRRRVSDEHEPPAVVSSSSVETVAVDLPMPELKEIQRLLLVEVLVQDPNRVTLALRRLNDLIMESNENKKNADSEEAVMSGAIGILVLTLKKWQQNEQIQFFGLRCLGNLSVITKTTAVVKIAVKMAVIKCGGVEVIVAAMKLFPGSIGIQQKALGCLQNVFSANLNTKSEVLNTADRFVNGMGGLGLIVKAMKKFPACPTVQLWSIGALSNLLTANKKDFKEVLLKEGAVAAVAMAMTKHMENANIKKDADNFMTAMFGGK